jgi:ATP-dependent Clp protease protease subunit
MILSAEVASDDVAAQLLRRRIVMLTGRLDGTLADDVATRLLLLDHQSHDGITMHVSVPDAELEASLGLLATVDLLAADITAIAGGTVGGAAVAVYCAAAHRQAHPHTQFVLREPVAELRGDAERLEVAAEQHRRQLETLSTRIAAATGREASDVGDDMAKGRLLTADEAVAYGLVHELTTR